MPVVPAVNKKRLAVVGAGPAGLAFAVNAASRGHSVTLFDALAEIGGQFNIAKQIPGKEEFYETLRYYRRMIELTGVDLRPKPVCQRGGSDRFRRGDPREWDRPAHASDRGYRSSEGIELSGCACATKRRLARRWRLSAAAGSAFDTAMYLSQPGEATSQNIAEFCVEWGIDTSLSQSGGLRPEGPQLPKSPRQIVMLQRKGQQAG